MPTGLTIIKSAIKTIAESVNGIGNVYDTMLYAKSTKELQELFSVNEVINTLMFRESSTTEMEDEKYSSRGHKTITWFREWKFILIYGYNSEQGSGATVELLKENLLRAFNDNNTFGGVIMEHNKLSLEQYIEMPYHNVMCHWLEFKMSTKDIISYDVSVAEPVEGITLVSPLNEATGVTASNADLEWQADENAWDYMVQVSTSPTFSTLVFQTTNWAYTKLTVPEGMLSNDTIYYWRVVGRNILGYGTYGTIWSFETGVAVLPEIPVLISPLASSETESVKSFLWNNSLYSSSYDFQLASDAGFTALIADVNINKTFYEHTFTANGTYYWRVRGRNVNGTSAWASSSVVIFIVNAETVQLVNRYSTKPDYARKVKIHNLYSTLKVNNLITKIDVLQIYNCHSVANNDWGLNFMGDYANASSSPVSVGLSVLSPVTTNGVSSYIKTGFSPATQGGAYTQNRAGIGLWKTNDTNSNGFDMSLAGTGYIRFQIKSGNSFFLRLNSLVPGSLLTGAQATGAGMHFVTRETATKMYYYRNKVLILSDNGQDSGAVPSGEVELGRGEGGNYLAGSFNAIAFTGYLTSAEQTILADAITAFLA